MAYEEVFHILCYQDMRTYLNGQSQNKSIYSMFAGMKNCTTPLEKVW